MKNLLFLPFVIILLLQITSQAKILIIVEHSYDSSQTSRINQFASDIRQYDNKTVEIIPWTLAPSGTNVEKCRSMYSCLETKYSENVFSNDPVEGAVLIGNLPVPQVNGGSLTEPFDYYYMDIWNSNTNSVYPNHDMTPFSVDPINNELFSRKYDTTQGDRKIDIWVSRIYGTILGASGHLRSSAPGGNPNTILDETGIYNEYLDRLHKRYTAPASVPSRGFAMGGTGDMIVSLQEALSMDQLNLPMYVEFNGGASSNDGQASSFNFASQLQAGPKGGITLGAYNGTVFPYERNARNCTYSQLTDARSFAPYYNRIYSSLDTNGWEWAGVFAHSGPDGFAFNYIDHFTYNGWFGTATVGPFWGNSMRRAGGYPAADNSGGYYYYFNPVGMSPDPYGYGNFRGKTAFFQYKVPSSGTYSVYINYPDDSLNCSVGEITLVESKLNAIGYPSGGTPEYKEVHDFSMKTHVARDGSSNWERVFIDENLTANDMVTLKLDANGQDGEVDADAVRFVCTTPAIDDIVDNVEPTTNPDGANIFSTQGFYTSDCVDRSFESLQDENGTTHDKFSKVPFFLTSSCLTNDFIYEDHTVDNMGNLLALGHNGLICMGTSGNNFPARGYTPFVNALASGKSFGEAFIDQANSSFITDEEGNLECMYALLGAGSLRAQPYIQFGSALEQNKTVSGTVANNSTKPVLISGVNVTSTGNYTVTSTVSASDQNFTGSEIVIRPETVLGYGSTVDIKAASANSTIINGSGTLDVTPSENTYTYVNTSYHHGMMFSIHNAGQNDSVTVKWQGVLDQNSSNCTDRTAILNGNGAQINNICTPRDGNGNMSFRIKSTKPCQIYFDESDWVNGTGCQ